MDFSEKNKDSFLIHKKKFAIILIVSITLSSIGFFFLIRTDKNNKNGISPIYITVWNTRKTSDSSSNFSQIMLPLVSDGNYNFTVKHSLPR